MDLMPQYFTFQQVLAKTHHLGETSDGGNKKIPNDKFVLVDAAPEWKGNLRLNNQGYASDLTRTYSVTRTNEMNIAYSIVEIAHWNGLNAYMIGKTWKHVCDIVLDSLVVGLRNFKLIVGDYEKLKQSNVVKLFMPHGIGHPVGLDVHDPIPNKYYINNPNITSTLYDFILYL